MDVMEFEKKEQSDKIILFESLKTRLFEEF
jgi:hypothetical protein